MNRLSYISLFQALGQWGRSKKRSRDERDLIEKKLEKAREGESKFAPTKG